MKTRIAVLIGLASASYLCLAGPGTPADSGFAPLTSTFYVTTNLYNYEKAHEHPSVDIAANGNVIFSWENDSPAGGFPDFETVWTLYDASGSLLTPPTIKTNRSTAGAVPDFQSTTNTYMSFFRSDNTAIGPYTGWGGYDAKANKFGNGIGFGSMCWEIGLEISEVYDINADDDGLPPDANDSLFVQLLNNDGTPFRPGVINGITNLGILSFADADVQPTGAIRTGGWDYLANGNIVLAGESRQAVDRALTGQPGNNTPVYRILTPAGVQVKGYAALSSEPIGGNMQAGIAVTANGFAARWNQTGVGSTIRLFDNAGNPTTANINLATLTGHPEVAQGGDGSGLGFDGNGVDAYVFVNSSSSAGTNTPWVTVINADGTLRWSRPVQDDDDPIDNTGSTDVDGAIDASGRVVVVFSSTLTNAAITTYARYIQARLFSKDGVPLGPRFVVSEWENPANTEAAYDSSNPRVAWRGNQVAVAWLGGNAPTLMPTLPSYKVLAGRLFTVPVSDNFNDGNDTSPLLAWQKYNPILTGTWSFPGGNKYRIQSAASPDPGTYGQGRAGSFVPGVFEDFYVAADVVDFDDTIRQVFGVAARIQNPGPGTTGGYLFSWEPGSGTLPGTSNGDLDITLLYNELPVDQIENESSGLHLERGKSYRFVLMGKGFDLVAEVYELPNTTTPIKRLTATDTTGLLAASGQLGIIVANNKEPTFDGPADATFDNFLASTGEPRIALSRSGGTITLSWPLIPFNLQSSPSLSTPNWTAVTTGISQVGDQFQYTAAATGAEKYYRLSYP